MLGELSRLLSGHLEHCQQREGRGKGVPGPHGWPPGREECIQYQYWSEPPHLRSLEEELLSSHTGSWTAPGWDGAGLAASPISLLGPGPSGAMQHTREWPVGLPCRVMASHMPASMPGRLLKFTAEGSRAISDNFCPGTLAVGLPGSWCRAGMLFSLLGFSIFFLLVF